MRQLFLIIINLSLITLLVVTETSFAQVSSALGSDKKINNLQNQDSIFNFWAANKWQDHFFKSSTAEENSDQIKGRYPKPVKWFLEQSFGWKPGLLRSKTLGCDRFLFEKKLQDLTSLEEKLKWFEKNYQDCQPEESTSNFLNSMKNISQVYDFKNNPFYQSVTLHFPGDIKTKAIFAFKDFEKRDLVILRPGIFASVEEIIAEKYLLMMLFEQSNFNLLVLENSTSPDHLFNNSKANLGGIKEGYENIFLASQLRKHPQFSQMIAKIHLFGVSLGGNGVLFANLLNQQNNYQYFDKTVLFCPVVDLSTSFEEGGVASVKNYFMDLWASLRLNSAIDQRGKFRFGFWQSLFNFQPRFVTSYYDLAEKEFVLEPEFYKNFTPLKYSGNFKQDLNFFKEITSWPKELYLFATKQDEIVNPATNYQRLVDMTSGLQKFNFLFPQGFHCSFPYAYNWDFISHMLLGILDQDHNQKTQVYSVFIVGDNMPDQDLSGSGVDNWIESVIFENESGKSQIDETAKALQVRFYEGKLLRTGKFILKFPFMGIKENDLTPAVEEMIKRRFLFRSRISKKQNQYSIELR